MGDFSAVPPPSTLQPFDPAAAGRAAALALGGNKASDSTAEPAQKKRRSAWDQPAASTQAAADDGLSAVERAQQALQGAMPGFVRAGENKQPPPALDPVGPPPIPEEEENIVTEIVTVANACIGMIIGKGGEQIRQLQIKSGAMIQVTRDDGIPSDTRTITVMGPPEEVGHAKELIKEITDSAARRDAMMGGGADGGMGAGPSPRPQALAPGSVEDIVSVPNRHVGLIIGKGGETIRMLQERSGANIQVTRDADATPGDPNRNITLSGSREQVDEARRLMMETIKEAEAGRSGGDSSGGGGGSSLPPGHIEAKILIPNNCVGVVIGKGGSTIQMLQAQAGDGTRIQMQKDADAIGLHERSVSITGFPQNVEYAKQLIQQKVEENNMRSSGMGGGGGGGGGMGMGMGMPGMMPGYGMPGMGMGMPGYGMPGMMPGYGSPYGGAPGYGQAYGAYPGYPGYSQMPSYPQTVPPGVGAPPGVAAGAPAAEAAPPAAAVAPTGAAAPPPSGVAPAAAPPAAAPAAAATAPPPATVVPAPSQEVYAQQLQYFQYYGGFYDPAGAWLQGQPPQPPAAVSSPLAPPPVAPPPTAQTPLAPPPLAPPPQAPPPQAPPP